MDGGAVCVMSPLGARCLVVVSMYQYILTALYPFHTCSMPWRKSGVRYSQNEIYLDIVEEMDAIVDANGQVRRCIYVYMCV